MPAAPESPLPTAATAPVRPPARRSGTGIRLLDLGCGDGSSLIDAQHRFGLDGVGLEIDSGRVARACARGLDVSQADIRDLDPSDYPDLEVVYLDNVLEHLASLDDIDTVLRFACAAASRLVSIRHPSFEDVEHLADLGLKVHWTDWPTSHTAPARLHELVAIANRHGRYDIDIRAQGLIRDSSNPLVLPIGAPPNQSRPDPAVPSVYREALHGPKPDVAFDRPVFQMFEIGIHTCGSSGRAAADAGLSASVGPGHADPSWLGQLRSTVGGEPIVAERTGGGTVVVEGGLIRPVSGTILARALRIRFGSVVLSDDDLEGLRPGPPVVLLKAPGESAFVVVGGRRAPVPAVGVSVQAGEEWFTAFEQDQPLDPLRAAAELQDERRLRSR